MFEVVVDRVKGCVLFAALVVAAACSSDTAPTDPALIARAAHVKIAGSTLVAPGEYTIALGSSERFTAQVTDSSGTMLTGVPVQWTVATWKPATAAATVDANGNVTGQSAGWVLLSAQAGKAGDQIAVYIHTTPASIATDADSIDLVVGGSKTVTFTPHDNAGAAIDFGATVTRAIADTTIAAIDSAGVVRGKRVGSTTVVARTGSITKSVPVRVRTVQFASVARGNNYACGLTPAGEALCWGENTAYRTGVDAGRTCMGSGHQYCGPTTVDAPTLLPTSLRFSRVSPGGITTCALTLQGAAYCWGGAPLGDGASLAECDDLLHGIFASCDAAPHAVAGGRTYSSISTGWEHACALTVAGEAYCWGVNFYGEIGDGSAQQQSTPVRAAPDLRFKSLSAGWTNTCGITVDGAAYCWGSNRFGALGNGTADTTRHASPVAIPSSLGFTQMAPGDDFICGLTADGRVLCSGIGYYLGSTAAETCTLAAGGLPPTSCSTHFVPINANARFTQVAASGSAPCALATDGAVWCWSYNTQTPTVVTGIPALTTLSTGYYASGCGMGVDGAAYCWTPIGNGFVGSKVIGQP